MGLISTLVYTSELILCSTIIKILSESSVAEWFRALDLKSGGP